MNTSRLYVALALMILTSLIGVAQELVPSQNKKGKWGYVDAAGNEAIPYKYDHASAFVDGQALVGKGDKYGYINTDGKETIKIQYSEIGTWDSRGRAKVAVGGSEKNNVLTGAKYGFIDRRGNVLLKPEYTKIEPFKDGLAAIVKGDKYGYINENLDFVIECKYSAVGSFNPEGFCWVAKGGKMSGGKITGAKYGVVNMSGREIIKPDYQLLGTFSERIFISHPIITGMLNSQQGVKMLKELAKKNNKGMGAKGFLAGYTGDTKNLLEEAKERATKTTQQFVDQIVASVPKDVGDLLTETSDYALLGYKFLTGELYTPLDMSLDGNFAVSKNKMFIDGPFTFDLRVNDKIGIIDQNGQTVVKPGQFGLSLLPTEGLIPVIKRGKKNSFQFNFCTSDGKLILKKWAQGTGVIPFQNGTAVIAAETGSYIIDKSGAVVSSDYELILPQTEGNYIVKSPAGYGLVSGVTGQEIVHPDHSVILPAADGMYCTRKDPNGQYGYLNAEGKYIIEPKYTAARSFRNGVATVSTSDGWGFIKTDNTPLINFEWDDALPYSHDNQKYCWVKKDGMWNCLVVGTGNKAFDNTYFSATNFNADGVSTVGNADGLFGTIDTNGTTILPIRFSNPGIIGQATSAMMQQGLDTMSEIEAHRLNLNLNPARNDFRLSHKIDNSMWEY